MGPSIAYNLPLIGEELEIRSRLEKLVRELLKRAKGRDGGLVGVGVRTGSVAPGSRWDVQILVIEERL